MKKIFVFVILFILALPLGYVLGINATTKIEGVENITELPNLHDKSYIKGQFQDQFTKWWQTHFGFRTIALKTKNQIYDWVNFNKIHDSSNGDIVQGTNSYLYSKGYIVESFLGQCHKLPKNINDLMDLYNVAKRNGIQVYFVLAPNKAVTYPEYIPLRYRFFKHNYCGYYDEIEELFTKNRIPVFNVQKLLNTDRPNMPYEPFSRTGTHWNFYGAGYALTKMTPTFNWPRVDIVETEMADNPKFLERDIGDLLNLWVKKTPNEKFPIPELRATKQLATEPVTIIGNSFSQEFRFVIMDSGLLDKKNIIHYENKPISQNDADKIWKTKKWIIVYTDFPYFDGNSQLYKKARVLLDVAPGAPRGYDFSQKNNLEISGMYDIEKWGRWGSGKQTDIKVKYDNHGKNVLVEFDIDPRLYPNLPTQTVRVPSPTVVTQVRTETRTNYVLVEKSDQKEMLIVNTDSIGDYILWRNFLREIKTSEKYKDYKISLLGCIKYKAFAEYLDSDIIDNFYWCAERPQALPAPELERERVALHNSQGLKHYYDTIMFVSPNSMDKRPAHEHLVSKVFFKNKIMHCLGINPHRSCNDLLPYTYVYVNHDASKFEFELNRTFFEDILGKKIELKHPVIEDEKLIFDNAYLREVKKEYIAINPCAYDVYRKWHPNNWAQVIEFIQTETPYDVKIVCGKNEEEYCRQMLKNAEIENVDVLAGLPIKDLFATLKLAKMYIGQDSGVFHIAAALNIRALCLSAGSAYWRFMGYPKDRQHIKVVFPRGTEDWINETKDKDIVVVKNPNCFYINSLHIDDVKAEIKKMLALKDVIFVHKFKTVNTGDLEICPYQYFPEFFDKYVVQRFDNDDMRYLKFKTANFILGGGGLINQNDNWNIWMNNLLSNKKNNVIGWGIGFNQHKEAVVNVKLKLENFTLLGVRDFNKKKYKFLPCISCLKKQFDTKSTKTVRKVGCICHWEFTDIPFDVPTMCNNQPFEDLIKFIKETDVLITNTYHMMYWATLLGKKVILFDAFSDKFDGFKYKPVKYSGKLASDIKKAKAYPEALKECRDLNNAFFKQVKKIIEGK